MFHAFEGKMHLIILICITNLQRANSTHHSAVPPSLLALHDTNLLLIESTVIDAERGRFTKLLEATQSGSHGK